MNTEHTEHTEQNQRKYIIGITGPAGSGKSTLANEFSSILHIPSFSFSTPIKKMLKQIGVEKGDPRFRHHAQTLGTEWGRKLISEGIWISLLESRLSRIAVPAVVIDDVRFENEAEFVRRHGILIHIRRPAMEKILESDHSSEQGVLRFDDDILVNNFEGESLREVAETLIKIYDILPRR